MKDLNPLDFKLTVKICDDPSTFTDATNDYMKDLKLIYCLLHIPSNERISTMFKEDTPAAEIAEQVLSMTIYLINKTNKL